MIHHVAVHGLLRWIDPRRLLGPGDWTLDGKNASTNLTTHEAADLDARLRGIGLGGSALTVVCIPPLPRAAVRAARTTDARRRRETTPGFTRAGTRLDDEGRWSLTPEALALTLGQRAGGRPVIDAGCGAGGNAIGFARGGSKVTAIEQHPPRLADARHNAAVYGVASEIQFVRGEAGSALAAIHGSSVRNHGRDTILFVDPPWGRDWPRDRVRAADVPMVAAAIEWGHTYADWIAEVWLKLPPSFDTSCFADTTPEAWYGNARGDERRVKFLTVRVRSDAPM